MVTKNTSAKKLVVKNGKVMTEKSENEEKQLIANIPSELHMKIKILAIKENKSIKEVVVHALNKYIESH